jgi:hypothetical protein
MPGALSEGEGVAAQYPGDEGIEGDPAVVFADDFEGLEGDTVAIGAAEQKGKKWDSAWRIVRVTQEPENVHSGRKALEIRHEEPTSHGVGKEFREGFDSLHVRYYMKYHREFPGCHHTGLLVWAGGPGITLGSGPGKRVVGVRPDGHSHFTARLDASPPWTRLSDRAPGRSNIYCYHMDQGRRWGDLFFPSGEVYPPENRKLLGEDFVPRPDFTAQLGRWYCYELMLKANTPGKRDGRVAFWVDGKLAGDFPGLRFRSTAALKVNNFALTSYSSQKHANKVMWYDDVVVATSYIGPRLAPE